MTYFELTYGIEKGQRHGGDLAGVVDPVPFGETTHHHVGVPNCLHLVHVVVFNNGVEQRVQIVQKIHHLKCEILYFGRWLHVLSYQGKGRSQPKYNPPKKTPKQPTTTTNKQKEKKRKKKKKKTKKEIKYFLVYISIYKLCV